jgi:predicted nucleic acid-binding protein
VNVEKPVIVVDATVILKWYLPEIYSEEARDLLNRYQVCSSETVVSQVASGLWKRIRTGEVKPNEGKRIMRNLLRLPIRLTPTTSLAANAMDLSTFSTRTFNESQLFVLAMREESKVVTADFHWYTMLSSGKLKSYIAFVNRLDLPQESASKTVLTTV